jgi:glycosyltransferase involved in cell wall biosynthesis
MKGAVEAARETHQGGLVWVQAMVDTPTKIAAYSHAQVFCCPSIYEPFGIINLEAMACETPVVASAVGGMKEVVVHGETGLLVPVLQQNESPFEPIDPPMFSHDLAHAINQLMADPDQRSRMAAAGRKRAVENYSWTTVAARVHALYKELLDA